ncbi:hypothetical protein HK098_008015 [Nowakowskiella sp. JEL0407]|nr:hypothetical protein HK098_008015 [Nowakowskiella sp. JEL0407]
MRTKRSAIEAHIQDAERVALFGENLSPSNSYTLVNSSPSSSGSLNTDTIHNQSFNYVLRGEIHKQSEMGESNATGSGHQSKPAFIEYKQNLKASSFLSLPEQLRATSSRTPAENHFSPTSSHPARMNQKPIIRGNLSLPQQQQNQQVNMFSPNHFIQNPTNIYSQFPPPPPSNFQSASYIQKPGQLSRIPNYSPPRNVAGTIHQQQQLTPPIILTTVSPAQPPFQPHINPPLQQTQQYMPAMMIPEPPINVQMRNNKLPIEQLHTSQNLVRKPVRGRPRKHQIMIKAPDTLVDIKPLKKNEKAEKKKPRTSARPKSNSNADHVAEVEMNQDQVARAAEGSSVLAIAKLEEEGTGAANSAGESDGERTSNTAK